MMTEKAYSTILKKPIKDKKAQISIFILIALVIVSTIGIGIYIMSSTKTVDVAKTEGLNSVEEYVKTCFKGYLESGINIILSQGGRIYREQGGTKSKPAVLDYDGTSISYGITKLKNDYENIKKNTPAYPWEDFPYVPTSIPIPGFENVKVDIENGRFRYGETTIPTIEEVTNDINSYVNSKSQDCLKFEQYTEEGITVASSTPTITTTINPLDVEVKIEIDINVTKGEEEKKITNFRTAIPVRIDGLIKAAQIISNDDITLINYDPSTIQQITVPSGETFNVLVNKNPVPSKNGDDIIIISDPIYTFRGNPAELQFARENRPPAISRVNTTFFEDKTFGYGTGCPDNKQPTIITSTDDSGETIIQFKGTYYTGPDTSAVTGTDGWEETIKAYDPDEDYIYYNITSITPTQDNLKQSVTLNSGQKTFYITASDGTIIDHQQVKDIGVGQCA